MYKYYETMTASPFNRHTPIPPISPRSNSQDGNHNTPLSPISPRSDFQDEERMILSRRPSIASTTNSHGLLEQSLDGIRRNFVIEHSQNDSKTTRINNFVNDYAPLSVATPLLLDARLNKELIERREGQDSELRGDLEEPISSVSIFLVTIMLHQSLTSPIHSRKGHCAVSSDLISLYGSAWLELRLLSLKK